MLSRWFCEINSVLILIIIELVDGYLLLEVTIKWWNKHDLPSCNQPTKLGEIKKSRWV
jgi:hypothetical protein